MKNMQWPEETTTVSIVALGEFRVSSYRGVIVHWDDDIDTRVLGVIDAMPEHVRSKLTYIHEHKGSVAMEWVGDAPDGYADTGSASMYTPDGDVWSIQDRDVFE